MKTKVLFLALLAMSVLAVPAQAADVPLGNRTFSQAYTAAAAGDTITVPAGSYGNQSVPAGTKTVTFRATGVAKVRQLFSSASNVTFDGLDLDAGGAKTTGAVFEPSGANTVFKNGRIGNVTDEKGALSASGCVGCVFDNVQFHDVRIATAGVHNECLYSQSPNITIKNSRFTNCATMDVFFTRGTWWGQPAYGGFTLTNNFFGKTYKLGGAVHYYSVVWGHNAPYRNVTARGNTFELPVSADGPFEASVESCNTPAMNQTGITKEACGVTPPPPPPPPPAPRCSNGIDDDGDTLIDYPADLGCIAASDTDESPADRDKDGVPDATDACPTVAGSQPNGCNPAPVEDCSDEIARIAALEAQLATAQALAAARGSKLARIQAILSE